MDPRLDHAARVRAAHIEAFVRDLRRRNLSPETIRGYCKGLERFERQTGTSLLEATRLDLRDWLDTLRIGPRTYFWYVSTLRVFYNWAVIEEVLVRSPAMGLVTPRYPRLVPRPIGRDDLELALHGARPRMKAWLALAAFAGFRAKEIAGLRREDVLDMVEPPVLVVSAPKGGRQRIVPLNSYVAHALRLAGLPRRSGWVFLSQRGAGPVRPPTVTKLVGRYLEDCGIEATLHQFRHAFATEVYRASRDLRLTQELMGHASPLTTSAYAAHSPGDAVGVVEGLGPWAADRKQRASANAAAAAPVVVPPPAPFVLPVEDRPPELAFLLSAFEEDQAREGMAAWTVKARVQLAVRVESRLMPNVALEASTDELADFILESAANENTRYTYVASLRAFYGWAKRQGHITVDPSAGLTYVLRQRRRNG